MRKYTTVQEVGKIFNVYEKKSNSHQECTCLTKPKQFGLYCEHFSIF